MRVRLVRFATPPHHSPCSCHCIVTVVVSTSPRGARKYPAYFSVQSVALRTDTPAQPHRFARLSPHAPPSTQAPSAPARKPLPYYCPLPVSGLRYFGSTVEHPYTVPAYPFFRVSICTS